VVLERTDEGGKGHAPTRDWGVWSPSVSAFTEEVRVMSEPSVAKVLEKLGRRNEARGLAALQGYF